LKWKSVRDRDKGLSENCWGNWGGPYTVVSTMRVEKTGLEVTRQSKQTQGTTIKYRLNLTHPYEKDVSWAAGGEGFLRKERRAGWESSNGLRDSEVGSKILEGGERRGYYLGATTRLGGG